MPPGEKQILIVFSWNVQDVSLVILSKERSVIGLEATRIHLFLKERNNKDTLYLSQGEKGGMGKMRCGQ